MCIHRWTTIMVLTVFVAGLTGCATDSGYYDPGRSAVAGAAGGAAAGAALGAIIGAASGHPGRGAAIGAATGAIAGGVGGALYAAHMNNRTRDATMAAQTYNYQPEQGNFVDVGEVSATPQAVRPGQEVRLGIVYTLLTPDNNPVEVSISREVRKDGRLVGQPYQVSATNTNGSYADQVGFLVPANAPPGLYTVTNRVISPAGSAEKTATFSVM